jgi:hypothetical protein
MLGADRLITARAGNYSLGDAARCAPPAARLELFHANASLAREWTTAASFELTPADLHGGAIAVASPACEPSLGTLRLAQRRGRRGAAARAVPLSKLAITM